MILVADVRHDGTVMPTVTEDWSKVTWTGD
jgi:hypothetical protein